MSNETKAAVRFLEAQFINPYVLVIAQRLTEGPVYSSEVPKELRDPRFFVVFDNQIHPTHALADLVKRAIVAGKGH